MTFIEEQLEKIKKEELERVAEVQVENTSFASKIVNDADFDTEVTENINYFEDAFKKIDEDRLNFEKSGGKEEEEIEEKSEKEQSSDMSNVGQVEVTEEPVEKETVVETKKISFFDRLLQLI